MTPLTSPESNIKKPRIDDLDEPPIQELPPSVASLALCSPSHPSLALAGQVDILTAFVSPVSGPVPPGPSLRACQAGFYADLHACLLICFILSLSFANFCTSQHWLGKVCL